MKFRHSYNTMLFALKMYLLLKRRSIDRTLYYHRTISILTVYLNANKSVFDDFVILFRNFGQIKLIYLTIVQVYRFYLYTTL